MCIDGVAGLPVDYGLDQTVDVELVAVAGAMYTMAGLGFDEAKLLPNLIRGNNVAPANFLDETKVIAS